MPCKIKKETPRPGSATGTHPPLVFDDQWPDVDDGGGELDIDDVLVSIQDRDGQLGGSGDRPFSLETAETTATASGSSLIPPKLKRGQADPLSGKDDASGSKRKRGHAAHACLNCRRRKARCEGEPPQCKTCALYNDECSWDEFGDGRRPVSRTFVQALKTRIKILEAEVETLKKGGAIAPVDGVAVADEVTGDEDHLVGGDESVDDVAKTMLHLRVSEDGSEVVFYGPTSAYAHSSPALQPRDASTPPSSHPQSTSVVDTTTPTRPGDFRRYLPTTPHLSSAQHTIVLSRFFKYFASWGLRAHPLRFREDMDAHLASPAGTALPRYSQYSPFLHNVILAIALTWADEPGLREADVRAMFARKADEYLVAELNRPLPATVQGLAIKSSYLSTDGEHTAGWAYYGMGERIAQTLGLNVDCNPCVPQIMTPDEVRRRTETFWTVFIQEQTWAVYTGRPHSVPEYSTPLPDVDPELDDMPFVFDHFPQDEAGTLRDTDVGTLTSVDQITLDNGQLKVRSQKSYVSTAFVEIAKLAVIMQRVLSALYGLKAQSNKSQKDSIVSDLALELDSWAEALPLELAINGHSTRNALPHVIMLQLAREWITIFIHRPCYRLTSTSSGVDGNMNTSAEAVRRCDRSAQRIITLLSTYHDMFTLQYCPPTMFNIAFTAGTTFLLSAFGHPTYHVKASSLRNAASCVAYLRLVGESWAAARQKSEILQDLLAKSALPQSLPGELGGSEIALSDDVRGKTSKTAVGPGRRVGLKDSMAKAGVKLARGGSVREGKFKFPLPGKQNKGNQARGAEREVEDEAIVYDDGEGESKRRKSLMPSGSGGLGLTGDTMGPPWVGRRQLPEAVGGRVVAPNFHVSAATATTATAPTKATATMRMLSDSSHRPSNFSQGTALGVMVEGQEMTTPFTRQEAIPMAMGANDGPGIPVPTTGPRQGGYPMGRYRTFSGSTDGSLMGMTYRITASDDGFDDGTSAALNWDNTTSSFHASPFQPSSLPTESSMARFLGTPEPARGGASYLGAAYTSGPFDERQGVGQPAMQNFRLLPGTPRQSNHQPNFESTMTRDWEPRTTMSPLDLHLPTSGQAIPASTGSSSAAAAQQQPSFHPSGTFQLPQTPHPHSNSNSNETTATTQMRTYSQWDSPPGAYTQFIPYLSSPHSGDPVGDSLWQNYTYASISTAPVSAPQSYNPMPEYGGSAAQKRGTTSGSGPVTGQGQSQGQGQGQQQQQQQQQQPPQSAWSSAPQNIPRQSKHDSGSKSSVTGGSVQDEYPRIPPPQSQPVFPPRSAGDARPKLRSSTAPKKERTDAELDALNELALDLAGRDDEGKLMDGNNESWGLTRGGGGGF